MQGFNCVIVLALEWMDSINTSFIHINTVINAFFWAHFNDDREDVVGWYFYFPHPFLPTHFFL